jgi:hypothetical protein
MGIAAASNGDARGVKPKLSRAEGNRLNAQKSTGPRTAAGKERSKFNALKHGMRAESSVLPGESPAEFEATRRGIHQQMAPRGGLEEFFADCVADDAWTFKRTKRAAAAQLASILRNQPHEQARSDRENAIQVGRRLIRDLAHANPFSQADCEGGPGHPGRLLEALQATVAGCDWLLDRFWKLNVHMTSPWLWRAIDGYELLRLLGFYTSESATDDIVAMLLMDSLCVADEAGPILAGEGEPLADGPLDERALGIDSRNREGAGDHLDRRSRLAAQVLKLAGSPDDARERERLKRFAPTNVYVAVRRLESVIDDQKRRIDEVRATRAELASENAAAAADVLASQTGLEGELARRYLVAHRRVLIRTVAMFYQIQNASEEPAALDQPEPDRDDALNRLSRASSAGVALSQAAAESSTQLAAEETDPPGERGSQADSGPPSPEGLQSTSPPPRAMVELPPIFLPTHARSGCRETVCGNAVRLPNEAKSASEPANLTTIRPPSSPRAHDSCDPTKCFGNQRNQFDVCRSPPVDARPQRVRPIQPRPGPTSTSQSGATTDHD